MSNIARMRLQAERKNWRTDHPHGFYAKPDSLPDGSLNIMRWKCGIPGPKDSIWDGATYPIVLEFPEEYPDKPPKCRFPAGMFHPNVYPSGTVCLSLVDEEKDWKPAITVKQILLGIQDLLVNPNLKSPAQEDAYHTFMRDREMYVRRVKEQAARIAAQEGK